MRREARTIHARAELRSGPKGKFLVGYAAKYGVRSEILTDADVEGPFVETIARGAFDRTVRESRDIKALFNHDSSKVLGSTRAGTLSLASDAVGLRFFCQIPDTSWGADARETIGRGDATGCSFRFYVVKDRVEERGAGPMLRTLLDVDIDEISVGVTFPAYPAAEVAVRSKGTAGATTERPRLDAAKRKLRLLDLGIRRRRRGATKGL
jgi:HK97 family phage prohead protease